jgi:hypothetical protein
MQDHKPVLCWQTISALFMILTFILFSEASMRLVREVLSHQDIFAKRANTGSDRVRPGQERQRKKEGCC